jgi:hypothetical protein
VLAALRAEDPRGFGAPCPALELVEALTALAGGSVTLVVRIDEGAGRDTEVTATLGGGDRARGRAEVVLRTAAFAMGWGADPGDDRAGNPTILRLRPLTP